MLVFILLFQYFSFSQSLEEKVGQLFIVGVQGKELTASTKQHLNQIKPGGVILFRYNLSTPYQTYKFNQQLNAWADQNTMLPLLIGTDQEGGVVSRIKTSPRAPSAAVIGKQQDLQKIQNYSNALGAIMSAYGFNLNFAPVLDQTTVNYGDFIGTRAFSYDLNRIVSSSSAFASGLKSQGILTVGKHFPGHGNVLVDSHLDLPKVNLSRQEIKASSAVPFVELYKKDLLDAVMVGHLSLPKIDARGIPATFSKPILNDFLRTDLAYEGLIITDDIEMKAAGISTDPAERAVLALEAGADMIMVAWNPKSQIKAVQGIINAVNSGRISIERIDESLNRIQTAKTYIHKFPEWKTEKEFLSSIQKIPWAKVVAQVQTSTVDVKLLRAKLNTTDLGNILVMSPDQSFLDLYPTADKIQTLPNFNIENLESRIGPDTLVIYHSTSPKLVKWISALSPKLRSQVIVMNTSRPAILNNGFLFVANMLERSYGSERALIREIQKNRKPALAN